MAENSKIEWTHHTFNPWRGCTKVSDGCKYCYAETMSGRNPAVLGKWGPRGTRVVAAESYWRQPLTWNAAARAAGERHRVFCASLADVFEGGETMPEAAQTDVDEARRRLWGLIEVTDNLDWLLLTKRPQNVREMVHNDWLYSHVGYPPNVWIGTSVENQQTADERIPHLLRVPAAVRFLSCEPLLGPVDVSPYLARKVERWDRDHEGTVVGQEFDCVDGIHWLIAGGESGSNARPMNLGWARSLRDQCQAAGAAFFLKQLGGVRDKRGGADAVLDGRTWTDMPTAQP
jgi:protein gp37